MTINIQKDSYLIIVYKDFEDILVSDFPEKKKETATHILNNASSQAKTNSGQKLLKVLNAGITSGIAENMVSKTGLSSSVQGRIQSSLYDIIADGKISKLEVAKDFIGSCTNELDSTAIDLGLPTSQALYEAIAPDGAGVIANDFIKHFQKKSQQKAEEKITQKNKIAQDTNVLKFKIITSDNESWNSNLPGRKTEKGFNIVDAIENENKTRDFSISIIQGDYSGITDMYAVKNILETIWNSKKPFDVYVNDANVQKTEFLEHCAINSISWESEGVNCLNASLNITKIPEWQVKTEAISESNIRKPSSKTRKKGKARSSKKRYNKIQTTQKTSGTKLNAGTPLAQQNLREIKSQIAQDRAWLKSHPKADGFYVDSKGKLKTGKIQSELRGSGLKGSLSQRGIK